MCVCVCVCVSVCVCACVRVCDMSALDRRQWMPLLGWSDSKHVCKALGLSSALPHVAALTTLHAAPSPRHTHTHTHTRTHTHAHAEDGAGGYVITEQFLKDMLQEFKEQRLIHKRFVFQILLQVRFVCVCVCVCCTPGCGQL
jgi:hypothetical protein